MNSDDFIILMKHNISSFIVRFILLLIIYVFLKNIFNDAIFNSCCTCSVIGIHI